MKKIIAQMLAVLVLGSFAVFVAGCGGGDKTDEGAKTDTQKPADKTDDTGAGK